MLSRGLLTMDTRWVKLWFLVMLCAEYCCRAALAGSVTASITPTPALKGSSEKHTIRCDYTLDSGDTFNGLELELGGVLVAGLYPGTSTEWGNPVPENLNLRGYHQGSTEERYLSLVLNDTRCSDNNRMYTCNFKYISGGVTTAEDTESVTVEAAPLPPNAMTRTPASDNVMELTNMVFECSGNVGFPAGSFHWYKFIGSESGTGQNLTDQAVQLTEQSAGGDDSCTYTRTSRLTLNLTRTEVDQNLVVRCRVHQKHLTNVDVTSCTDVNTDFCRMSPQIRVQYPVSVSVMSDTVTRVEGGELSVTCNMQGNPTPSLVEWHREGENTTTTEATLTLTQLTLNDSGTYVCTAYNTIAGVTYNASVTVSLTVEATTTPPPTTTPLSTTTESTTTEGGADRAGGGDSTTTIIIVVVVVGVVVIVAVIAVIFFVRRRRKGKEVEEPPEKPFNNHAGINTVATRPDLVNNDYNNPPGFKNEDGLAYAELQFDNKPRSRRPLAINDSNPEYSDVSMPQV